MAYEIKCPACERGLARQEINWVYPFPCPRCAAIIRRQRRYDALLWLPSYAFAASVGVLLGLSPFWVLMLLLPVAFPVWLFLMVLFNRIRIPTLELHHPGLPSIDFYLKHPSQKTMRKDGTLEKDNEE